MNSALLIEEPPLQVLPSLALAIGLNEAIVLQQLHYLLRNPKFGKRIAEEQWIFNTYEAWRADYFPFWDERTIRRVFTSLAKRGLVKACQPEGRLSRRKYYAIDMQRLASFSDAAKLSASMRPKVAIPSTKTTVQRSLKKTKETSSSDDAVFSPSAEEEDPPEEHPAVWKPITGTKEEQLARIKPPTDFPSEREYDDFITKEGLDHIGMGKRGDLYLDLCTAKWHDWTGRRWNPIRDWKAYVRALDAKMEDATHGGF